MNIMYRIKSNKRDTLNWFTNKLLPAFIDPEDVEQQAHLLELEGKVPHKAIIAKEMLHNSPDLHYANWLPLNASEVAQEVVPMSASDYDTLILFFYSSPVDIEILNNFLDNPEDETALENLLNELYAHEIITKKQWDDSKPKAKSIRVLILEKIIERGTMSKQEILEHISTLIISKRPAEAVRISIKRLLDSGKIKEVNGYYTATND